MVETTHYKGSVYLYLAFPATGTCFLFDGSTKPFSFSRGTLPGDSPTLRYSFEPQVDDFMLAKSSRAFVRALRWIMDNETLLSSVRQLCVLTAITECLTLWAVLLAWTVMISDGQDPQCILYNS